jgi:3'-phosphoadenosine 5'-phosphosulfate (PAPS) 3'-phosphatase
MEWDTAAAHSVVEAAGGSVMDFEGRPLEHNKEDSLTRFHGIGSRRFRGNGFVTYNNSSETVEVWQS